jgi:LEA14-like dessication related protein
MPNVKALLICLGMMLLTGCEMAKTLESTGLVKRPTVTLEQLTLTGLDSQGIGFNLGVAVNNPNPLTLQLVDVGYQLHINGKPLVSGRQADGFALKTNDISMLQVPIHLSFQDLSAIGQGLLQQKSAQYVLHTQVGIKLPGLGIVPFNNQQSGVLPMPEMSGLKAFGF